MADIQDPNALDQPSPGDDLAGNDTGRGNKRNRASMAGDDDDDDDEKGGRERRKIEIKFIQVSLLIQHVTRSTNRRHQDKSRRHITFSKRKAGIMKKVSPIIFSHFGTLLIYTRPTNYPSSPAPKSSSSSSPRPVSSTPSPPPNFSPSSQRPKARTSSKPA
jgi:hypothetical protein